MKILILLLFIANFSISQENTLAIAEIFDKMDSSIQANQKLQFQFLKEERCGDKYEYSNSLVKLQISSPYKVYMKSDSPRKGMEILFGEGRNNEEVLINTNSFPYFNLSLDPLGELIRKDQHHTILELGFGTMQGVVADFRKRLGDKSLSYFVQQNDLIWDNRECYKILIDYTDFAFNNYTVLAGEDVNDIAKKLHLSAYMIVENNEHISDYNDVSEGEIIQIPNLYAKVCEMFIDKESFLPIRQVVYDHKGLYEKYEYKSLILTPPFERNELEHNYAGYGF
jgi:outer membrane lipoprotein-sorting protein